MPDDLPPPPPDRTPLRCEFHRCRIPGHASSQTSAWPICPHWRAATSTWPQHRLHDRPLALLPCTMCSAPFQAVPQQNTYTPFLRRLNVGSYRAEAPDGDDNQPPRRRPSSWRRRSARLSRANLYFIRGIITLDPDVLSFRVYEIALHIRVFPSSNHAAGR
jgi:hypothetical protein